MTISLIICFLTSLYLCLASWTKLRKEYKEATLFLFIAVIFYSMLLLYGVGGRLAGSISNTASMQQMYALINNTTYDLQMLNPILIITTIGISFLNVALGIIVLKTKSPITWGLLFIIFVIGILSCIGSIIGGTNLMSNFFLICCGIMAYFAFVLDLTYKEFCVLGNIYLQATICLLSAIAPVMISIRRGIKGEVSIIKLTFVTINLITHIVLYTIICKHYWMPLEPAFNLCYRELVQCAATTGSTYIIVNFVIFVIFFVVDLLYNAVLYKIVKGNLSSKKNDKIYTSSNHI